MDVILGIIVIVLVLVLDFAGYHFELKSIRWLRRHIHPFMSRLLVAVLAGFIVFVLITDRITRGEQKIAVILVSSLLIWANLFLGPKDESQTPQDKQSSEEI